MTKDQLKVGEKYPCILEVDFEYPEKLYDLHNDNPLTPERFELGSVEKLINVMNKKNMFFTIKTSNSILIWV